MKKPMTTTEYFKLICDILKQKQMMPDDMLDYKLPAYDPFPMLTYQFDIQNNLDYGSCEGIYLDLSIVYYEDRERKTRQLGTFKTLQTGREAMRTMAKLLADFIVEDREYVNSHLDDFTWTGFDVYGINEDGSKGAWGYSCAGWESAESRKEELLKEFPSVEIRNNATREHTVYKGKE